MTDYILKFEDSLSTETHGYAVFYPNDGFLTDVLGSLEGAEEHRRRLLNTFPESYVVRVLIERVA